MGHQGPDDPRHLVRQGDGDQHARLARQHAGQPCSSFTGITRRDLCRRARAQDQQPSQAALAHLGRSPQPLLAAAGVLPRDETEPSRKVAPAAEGTGGRCQSHERGRDHRADTRTPAAVRLLLAPFPSVNFRLEKPLAYSGHPLYRAPFRAGHAAVVCRRRGQQLKSTQITELHIS